MQGYWRNVNKIREVDCFAAFVCLFLLQERYIFSMGSVGKALQMQTSESAKGCPGEELEWMVQIVLIKTNESINAPV